ncbi:hypothetical protein, partial [Clostridioides difficile]|uniref:hypothetical protein n=1 Tax=Clostridioides difficile TaxID=1496 RepID=UPI001A9A3A56
RLLGSEVFIRDRYTYSLSFKQQLGGFGDKIFNYKKESVLMQLLESHYRHFLFYLINLNYQN